MFFAATVYAVGKTFLWPTMLGVVGERFPKSATVAMAMLGCVGMLSAGYLGGPGIGYKQDYFASQYLQEKSEEAYNLVKALKAKGFLNFPVIKGIDGKKAGMLADDGEQLMAEVKIVGDQIDDEEFEKLKTQRDWWNENKEYSEKENGGPVGEATLHGSRMAIRYTALVPAAMAVLYLLLLGLAKVSGSQPKSEH